MPAPPREGVREGALALVSSSSASGRMSQAPVKRQAGVLSKQLNRSEYPLSLGSERRVALGLHAAVGALKPIKNRRSDRRLSGNEIPGIRLDPGRSKLQARAKAMSNCFQQRAVGRPTSLKKGPSVKSSPNRDRSLVSLLSVGLTSVGILLLLGASTPGRSRRSPSRAGRTARSRSAPSRRSARGRPTGPSSSPPRKAWRWSNAIILTCTSIRPSWTRG